MDPDELPEAMRGWQRFADGWQNATLRPSIARAWDKKRRVVIVPAEAWAALAKRLKTQAKARAKPEPKGAAGWRPIKTAPRKGGALPGVGKFILLAWKPSFPGAKQTGEGCYLAKRRNMLGGFYIDGYRVKATHWQPLPEGPHPLLFETMVFPENEMGELDCIRTSNWDDALEAHNKMCRKYGMRKRVSTRETPR